MQTDNNADALQVLVCHEAPLVRAGIAALLDRHADIAVTQSAGDEGSPWREHMFDAVVADYSSGLRCAQELAHPTAGRPRQRGAVLIVTNRSSASEIHHAIASGVRGYLLADCEGLELQRAVRTVARGARCFDDLVSSRMAESLAHATLTQREDDVLRLLAGGCCNKVIAQRLDIAVGTVKAHIRAILDKLDVRTRLQAAALANDRGMLRVPPPQAPRRPPDAGGQVRATPLGQLRLGLAGDALGTWRTDTAMHSNN